MFNDYEPEPDFPPRQARPRLLWVRPYLTKAAALARLRPVSFHLGVRKLGPQVRALLRKDIRFFVVMIRKLKQHLLELVTVVR